MKLTIYRSSGEKLKYDGVKNIKDENGILTFEIITHAKYHYEKAKFKDFEGYEIYEIDVNKED